MGIINDAFGNLPVLRTKSPAPKVRYKELEKLFFKAKAQGSEDLIPYGSWEVLLGTLAEKNDGLIWEDFLTSDYEQIYGRHAVVFGCVRKVFSAAQEAELQLIKPKKDGWEVIDDHYLLDVMYRPNPKMSYSDLIAHIISHLLLTGYSYVWEFRNRGGMINELWPVPTSWVTRVKDNNGVIIGYKVKQGNMEVPVPPQDITLMYLPDPSNPLLGLGPMQASIRDYQTDCERENYMAEMLTNMKIPGAIIKQPEMFTPEQKKEIRALLADKIGRGKRGDALFLEGEKSSIEMIAPLKDLDWPGLTNLSETRICSAFGVPPILVGVRAGLESATYSNYEQADKSFYRETMIPLWRSLAEAFTRGFIYNEGGFDTDIEFHYNIEAIKQLQEDTKETTDRALSLFRGSVITRNEARNIIGLDPLKSEIGDVILQPVNLQEINLNDAFRQDNLLGIGEEEEPDLEHKQEWEEGQESNTEEEEIVPDEEGATTADEEVPEEVSG